MSDVLDLSGSITTRPAIGAPSGFPSLSFPLAERMVLVNMQAARYELDADDPVNVQFGGVTNAQVLFIKAVGGKVRVRITSADGATQAIPVSDMLYLECVDVPITAIDLTRVAGTETTVEVFLGEQS
jgi:hypothetical protein